MTQFGEIGVGVRLRGRGTAEIYTRDTQAARGWIQEDDRGHWEWPVAEYEFIAPRDSEVCATHRGPREIHSGVFEYEFEPVHVLLGSSLLPSIQVSLHVS